MPIKKQWLSLEEFEKIQGGDWSPGPHTHPHTDITDWGDWIDQAVKQASSPTFANLNLGVSPLIRQLSGALTIQTNEGVNTVTYVDIKGKGVASGRVRCYDEDDAEYLQLSCQSGAGHVRTIGATPGRLALQYSTAQDIKCWDGIAAGNPYFYIYGFKAGDAVRYGRHWVDTDGVYQFDAEIAGYIRGSNVVLARWSSTQLRLYDNKLLTFGGGADYSIGYHEPTDTFQIVDGSILNANIRAKLPANGYWEFYDRIGIGKTPTCELDVNGIVKADTFHLQAGVTPNLGWLSDVTLGVGLEEGETIMYDQGSGEWIDAWGIEYDNPRLVWKMYTDFFSAGTASNDPWVGASMTSGTLTARPGESNHPGIVRFSSAASISSGYRFLTSTNCILLGGAESTEFVFKTGVSLTDVRIRLGFQDSLTDTAPTDGLYIDINGTTLKGITRNNGSETVTGTTYTISTSIWYRVKCALSSDKATATFWLYSEAGTQLWSNTTTTNIPTATGREVGHGVVAWVDSASGKILIEMDMMVASRAGTITR